MEKSKGLKVHLVVVPGAEKQETGAEKKYIWRNNTYKILKFDEIHKFINLRSSVSTRQNKFKGNLPYTLKLNWRNPKLRKSWAQLVKKRHFMQGTGSVWSLTSHQQSQALKDDVLKLPKGKIL